jgi:hypothetical protein
MSKLSLFFSVKFYFIDFIYIYINRKRSKLEEMLKNITLERKSISEAMIFCIDNAEKAEEIVECLVESITQGDLTLNKRV